MSYKHAYDYLIGREFMVQSGFPFPWKTPYAIPAGTRMIVVATYSVDDCGVLAVEPGKEHTQCLFAGTYVEQAIAREERASIRKE